MPKWSTEAKNLDDGEWKIHENLTQRNKRGRRAYQTAGRKDHTQQQERTKEQKEQCQLQAETYEENNVSKKEAGPMTRNKDTESHRHMTTEQKLNVAEKAREHQVEIEEEIGVDKQTAAESKGK